MKILQIADYFQPCGGNFIASLCALEKALTGRGDNCVYAFPSAVTGQPWYAEFAQNRRIEIIKSATPKSEIEIGNILLKHKPDIVHSHFDSFDICIAKACKQYQKKTRLRIQQVWHLHNQKGYNQYGLRKLYWRLRFLIHYGYYSRDVSIISVSDEMNRFITKYHHFVWRTPFPRIETIPNGIELSRCGNRVDFKVHKPFAFLAFGRSNPQKRIDLLVKAAQILIDKGKSLKVVITKGDAYSVIEEMFDKNIPQWIEFIQPSDNIVQMFEMVDCFVSTSLHETFSYAICEASIFGLPVIQSDIEGTLWNASNPSAFLFPSQDAQALADRMEHVMSIHENEMHNKCLISQSNNRKNYSVENWCEKVIRFYQEILKKRVLIVSSNLSHPTDAGNRAAIMAQVNSLKNLGADVHFLFANTSLRHNMDFGEMKQYWGNHYHQYNTPIICRIDRYLIDFIREKICHGYWSIDDHYPWGISNYINRIDANIHFDAIIVQYIRLSRALGQIHIPRKAVFTHDVFSYKDIRTDMPFYETCTAHDEAKALQRCPSIFAIQQNEAVYFKYLSPRSKIYTVYSPYTFHPQPLTNTRNILFLASTMTFNVEAINWFLDNVWPKVIEAVPNVQLLIAGAVCAKITSPNTSNVQTLGHVKSLDDFYLQGDIVINPVFHGTGLKIKTFEALSFGKTTIVNSHSLEGIYHPEKAPLIVANTPEEWVSTLSTVLSDKYDHLQNKKRAEAYILEMNRYILSQYQQFLTE